MADEYGEYTITVKLSLEDVLPETAEAFVNRLPGHDVQVMVKGNAYFASVSEVIEWAKR